MARASRCHLLLAGCCGLLLAQPTGGSATANTPPLPPRATAPANSSVVLWTGRTVPSAAVAGGVAFDCEGVTATFTVSAATSVQALFVSGFLLAPPPREAAAQGGATGEGAWSRRLQDSSFPKFGVFRTFVDGQPVGNITVFPGTSTLQLAGGLDPSVPHTVTLLYLTDAVYNTWPDVDCPNCTQAVAWFGTDGAFGAPPARRTRRMLVFGDSITAGNAVHKPCANASTDDYGVSYAHALCEAFEAECQTVAVSSKGLFENCCDTLPVTVPDYARRVVMQDPSSVWEPASFIPDAVIIALGTNDAGKMRTPALQAAFAARYVQFMVNISTWAGWAPPSGAAASGQASPAPPQFFLAIGPITEAYAPWVLNASSIAAAQYGLPSTLLNFTGAPLDGCNHPGVAGHAAMTAIAQPVVARVMGW